MATNPDVFLTIPEPATADESPPQRAARLNASCAEAMLRQLAGELDEAAQMFRDILAVEPQHAAANYCSGMLLVQRKRPGDGLPNLLAAIVADPQVADYWLGYLEGLVLAGRIGEARQTLALARRHGLAGRAADDLETRLSVKIPSPEAPAPAPLRAARRRAERAAAQLESQVIAQVKGRQFAAAQATARTLTSRFPDRGLGWKILGALLGADHRSQEALAAMQEATRRLPDDAEAFCNLGVMLSKQYRFIEAEAALRHAIAVDPAFDDAYLHLGFVYASLEKFPEAEAMFRRAVADSKAADNVQNDMRHSSLAFLLTHNPDIGAVQLFDEHRAVGTWLEGAARPTAPRHGNVPDPERRLRIGIVSGDLKSHAIASFIEPVLEELRLCAGLEMIAFSNSDIEDAVTLRMRACFARWHAVSALTDAQLVKLVKAEAIDVLIDLSGHTSFNRLRVFARKPAPLQAGWLGYPGTSGLRAMDYYLADPHFLPPGRFDESFTEKLAYLPAAWTFAPHEPAPVVNPLPALEAGFVTFGSFNRVGKINPFTVHLWARLLRELPSAILVLAGIPDDARRRSLTDLFTAAGVAAERIAFVPRTDMHSYLALHQQIDLCLDTFPYTGGTTTNHALWMGVPTLTLAGETPASRQCAANLGHLGLEDFIAADADDFVKKGVAWAGDPVALGKIRDDLRKRWRTSPLRQPRTVARGLDAALRHMWRRWCQQLPPESFAVDASVRVSE